MPNSGADRHTAGFFCAALCAGLWRTGCAVLLSPWLPAGLLSTKAAGRFIAPAALACKGNASVTSQGRASGQRRVDEQNHEAPPNVTQATCIAAQKLHNVAEVRKWLGLQPVLRRAPQSSSSVFSLKLEKACRIKQVPFTSSDEAGEGLVYTWWPASAPRSAEVLCGSVASAKAMSMTSSSDSGAWQKWCSASSRASLK